jgi:hypothetical protein
MELRYIENISTDKTSATMRLYGRIGDAVNGAAFAAEMRYLSEMCNGRNMKVRLLDPGRIQSRLAIKRECS